MKLILNRTTCLFFLFSFFLTIAMSNDHAVCSIPKENSGKDFCDAVNDKFLQFRWNTITCNPDLWKTFDYSSQGHPLLYQEVGFDKPDNRGPVNILLCGVHGDEPSGIYTCFQLVKEILSENSPALRDFKLVVAPLVNPDGFFANSRQNGNGVDPNRNLPTEDWDRLAQEIWVKHGKDPRKYPGDKSGSEVESQFQTSLINKYKPDKIIAIHSPLGFLDFDGPGDQKYHGLFRAGQRAKVLGSIIEANTKDFIKLVDFQFFPGSLGNYAGQERKIPTYTLELPSSDPSMAHDYWTVLRVALVKALSFEVFDNNESNPYFRNDVPAHQLAQKERAAVNTRSVSPETKANDTFLEMKTMNVPERSRIIIIASLLAAFVICRRVVLQRKQLSLKSDRADYLTNVPDLPLRAEKATADSCSSNGPRYLSRIEDGDLINACGPHQKQIDLTALHTGLKGGEILNLGSEDVDFVRNISQTAANMTLDKRIDYGKVNYIHKGSRIAGDINVIGDLVLSGHVEGNITAQENANIFIQGSCKGNIVTPRGDIDISGKLQSGEIFTEGNVSISGEFKGGKVKAGGKIYVNCEFSGRLE